MNDERTEKGAKAVSAAISRLILGHNAAHCFFATLALKIAGGKNAVPDWNISTCCTDGRKLRYNPDFMAGLSPEEAEFVMAHEVLHCTNNHHVRRGARDLKLFNIAADLVINPILREAGIGKAPKGALFPGTGEYAGISVGLGTEETYARLLDQGGQEGSPGDQPDPGACGGVEDAGDPAESRESEAEWEVAVAQAHQLAKQRGDLPGCLEELVQRALAPDTSVADYLWEFISRSARNDFSWMAPNRRFLSQGVCLPGMQSEELGNVVCMVDGSGSCWDPKIVQRFAELLQGVLETFDCELAIIYHDIPVHAVETWKSSDGPLVLTPRGGGGTSHVPAFEYIDRHHLDPTCAVALTDCYTTFPSAPDYPVLWACVGNPQARVPFGTVLNL
jgi:predicted metal-dependent peptidase